MNAERYLELVLRAEQPLHEAFVPELDLDVRTVANLKRVDNELGRDLGATEPANLLDVLRMLSRSRDRARGRHNLIAPHLPATLRALVTPGDSFAVGTRFGSSLHAQTVRWSSGSEARVAVVFDVGMDFLLLFFMRAFVASLTAGQLMDLLRISPLAHATVKDEPVTSNIDVPREYLHYVMSAYSQLGVVEENAALVSTLIGGAGDSKTSPDVRLPRRDLVMFLCGQILILIHLHELAHVEMPRCSEADADARAFELYCQIEPGASLEGNQGLLRFVVLELYFAIAQCLLKMDGTWDKDRREISARNLIRGRLDARADALSQAASGLAGGLRELVDAAGRLPSFDRFLRAARSRKEDSFKTALQMWTMLGVPARLASRLALERALLESNPRTGELHDRLSRTLDWFWSRSKESAPLFVSLSNRLTLWESFMNNRGREMFREAAVSFARIEPTVADALFEGITRDSVAGNVDARSGWVIVGTQGSFHVDVWTLLKGANGLATTAIAAVGGVQPAFLGALGLLAVVAGLRGMPRKLSADEAEVVLALHGAGGFMASKELAQHLERERPSGPEAPPGAVRTKLAVDALLKLGCVTEEPDRGVVRLLEIVTGAGPGSTAT